MSAALASAASWHCSTSTPHHPFPSLARSHSHPQVDRHLPEAFSVLGFAFYMQPFLLPVFKELPRGSEGISIAEQAVHFVLYVSATLAYGTVGVFGASIYGQVRGTLTH